MTTHDRRPDFQEADNPDFVKRIWLYIVYSLRIRRVEYRLAELPIFLIPALLSMHSTTQLYGAIFWEGLIVFFFLFAFGDLLNCLADRKLDAVYKPQLSEAVAGIGVGGVLVQAILSAVAAIVLTIHLVQMTGHWLLLPGVFVGLALAAAYSIEPVRLKGRGLLQLVFYWLGLFTAPMLFSAMLFTSLPSWQLILVCVALGAAQTGPILLNTAEDYPEDRDANVRTVIVATGLHTGMHLALGLTFAGGLSLVIAFSVHANQSWPYSLWLAPLAIAVFSASIAIYRLIRSLRTAGSNEAILLVRNSARFAPLWLTSNALCGLIAAIADFAL